MVARRYRGISKLVRPSTSLKVHSEWLVIWK
jgi:hypothetical protein